MRSLPHGMSAMYEHAGRWKNGTVAECYQNISISVLEQKVRSDGWSTVRHCRKHRLRRVGADVGHIGVLNSLAYPGIEGSPSKPAIDKPLNQDVNSGVSTITTQGAC